MAVAWLPGLVLSTLAYVLIGGGAGAADTSLLALLATVTPDRLTPAAAMTVWLMMILGIAVTAGGVGALIDPYTPARLLQIVAAVGLAAVALSALAAGFGGLAGAAGSHALRLMLPANEAFGLVFLAEAALFLTAAAMAARTLAPRPFAPHPAAIAGE